MISKRTAALGTVGLVLIVVVPLAVRQLLREDGSSFAGYTGSRSCRGCHELFYELWAPSHHGTAMQPFDEEFAATEVVPLTKPLRVGEADYLVEIEGGKGEVVEKSSDGERRYRIAHALGGKNVYYFLTQLKRGRLQVLPVAFDVRDRSWFDAPSSMVRHFESTPDEPVYWRDRALTFNTSCYGCHVSQLSTNYDRDKDSYHTEWAEPGINCETCHGGAAQHIEAARAVPQGGALEDLKIISVKQFDVAQVNSLCASCHSKARIVATGFTPGDRYFDYFGLTTLEHEDFYPDGRDLGENYTLTSWLMSPCVAIGALSCLQCHTSSGRYRYGGDNANDACVPCHEERVRNAAAHTHHSDGSPGNKCIACHMPTTEFARMRRSDHSMLPPTPATTIEYGSPNACNICHSDRDAEWADRQVRQWRTRDYQAPVLYRAALIAAARRGNWDRLPEMLAYIERADRDPVFATSLIRLVERSGAQGVWPIMRRTIDDPDPMVRAAAAHALAADPTAETLESLSHAAKDEYRIVRVNVGYALSAFPQALLVLAQPSVVRGPVEEFEQSLEVRPDDWASHYNKGNYLMARGQLREAVASFDTASRLEPAVVPPFVNAAMAYNMLGDNVAAERSLRLALEADPDNPVANFNLALLLAELDRSREAEAAFRRTLAADSMSAAAAYNLGVLLASRNLPEAVEWCARAAAIEPGTPRYAYTHAFFLNRIGDTSQAIAVLRKLTQSHPEYGDSYLLLGSIYESQGRTVDAISLYEQVLDTRGISSEYMRAIQDRLVTLRNR
jgi:tetratricopeptide (TPR) repeat protein